MWPVDWCRMGVNVRHDGICSSDVSILHEWSAVSRIPVSYLSLPARTPAGLLSLPNRTTGTKKRFVSIAASAASSSSVKCLSEFLMCIFWPVAVFNWWSLQQCLFQQPKSIHTTSSGPSRSGPAAQVFPEANLFLQVSQHSISFSNNICSMSWKSQNTDFSFFFSCLIAMALKNSKTGSLPVSEIYSFMKEHFPYFKVWC